MTFITVLALVVESRKLKYDSYITEDTYYKHVDSIYEGYYKLLIINNMTEEHEVIDRESFNKLRERTDIIVMNETEEGRFNFGYNSLAKKNRINYVCDESEDLRSGGILNGPIMLSVCGEYCRVLKDVKLVGQQLYTTESYQTHIIELPYKDILESIRNYSCSDASTSVEPVQNFEMLRNNINLLGIQSLVITEYGTAIVRREFDCDTLVVPEGVVRIQFSGSPGGSEKLIKQLILPKSCKDIYGSTHIGHSLEIDEIYFGGVETLRHTAFDGVNVGRMLGCESIKRIEYMALGQFAGEAHFINATDACELAGYKLHKANVTFCGQWSALKGV